MTIATTTNRVDAPGNGSATSFSFAPVVIFEASDLQVTVRDSLGNETAITQGGGSANFSVTISKYPGSGAITYPASGGSPLPTGSTIVIKRIVPLLQSVSLGNQGAYFPNIQEGEYDYLTSIDQQQQEQLNRTVQVAATDAAIPLVLPTSAIRAGQFLAFDGSGNPVAAVPAGVGVPISSVMQAVVTAASLVAAVTALFSTGAAALASTLLTCYGIGSTFVRSIFNKAADVVTVGDFGAKGDSIQDDTTFIQAAINQCQTSGATLHMVGWTGGSTFKTTAQLNISGSIRIKGSNPQLNVLAASGNFASVLNLTSAAGGVHIDHLGISTTGTTTQCLTFAQGAQVAMLTECAFTGNLSGYLVYSQASGYIEFWGCLWNCNAAGTTGIFLDGFNQNAVFMGGHAGGAGEWLLIGNSTGNIANNVQGMKATAFTSICTGTTAAQVSGAAFSTQFIGCILDQAGTTALLVSAGSSLTQVIGGYYGLVNPASGIPIVLTATAGPGTTIDGVQTYGGSNAISVQASGSSRNAKVNITNNIFNAVTTVSLSLDSVLGCNVSGNMDTGSPSNGSWATVATFGAGSYVFGENDWYTSAPVTFHTASSYHARPDRGITLANKGVASSSSGTSIVVTHGLTSVAPNVIGITQLGGAGMNSNVSAVSGTTFTITYGSAGAATFMWEAEYYT